MGKDTYQSFMESGSAAGPRQHCANVSLFRFLGHMGVSLGAKRVLEVGFGGNHGADLIEAHRRGAEVYGVDMMASLVASTEGIDPARLAVCKAGAERLPFDGGFDLIFSRDTLYYMTDDEIRAFLNDAHDRLLDGGQLVVQFIEGDLEVNDDQGEDFTTATFASARPAQLFEDANPVRFLKPSAVIAQAETAGLRHSGSKRLIQSYGTTDHTYRVDKYLAFAKG